MIKIENYPNAYKEVYVILNNMEKEDVNKIPESFINAVKKNMNNEYEFELDKNLDFEEQDLLQETKAILAYIFLNYWGTEEQNSRIKRKFKQDIMIEEKQKEKLYPKELFENENYKETREKEEITQMMENKKENILEKIVRKLKNIFRKIKNKNEN